MIIDSNYKVIPNTKNGVMDNFKINGNTLVNMWGSKISDFTLTAQANFNVISKCIECTTTTNAFSNFFTNNLSSFKPNTEYTLICNIIESTLPPTDAVWVTGIGTYNDSAFSDNWKMVDVKQGTQIKKMRTKASFDENKDKLVGIRSYIHNESGTVGSKVKLQLIVLEGDHTQNPPPYIEGLKSVGDGKKLEVLTRGKNLMDISFFNEINDIYDANGQNTNNPINMITGDFIQVLPSKSYTVAATSTSTYSTFYEYDKDFKFLGMGGSFPLKGSRNFVTKPTTKYIRAKYQGTDKLTQFQLEEGTQATPYEPYKSSKQQIEYYPNRGSLFDVSKIPAYIEDVNTLLTREGDVITVKGKKISTVDAYTDTTRVVSGVHLEKDKKYTFEFKSDINVGGTSGSDTVEMFWFLDGVSTGALFNVQGKATITCTKTGMYYPRFDVNKGDTTHKFWDIFVSEGDTYKPIGSGQLTPVIARKLSDTVKDTVDLSEGIYTKKCGVKVFNGSETFITRASIGTLNRYDYVTTDRKLNVNNLICDKFRFVLPSYTPTEADTYTFSHNTQDRLIFNVPNMTMEQFKTWLQSNNVTVVYELSQEELYECTKFYPSTFDLETTFNCNSIIPTTYETDLVSGLVDMTRISNEQSINLECQKNKLANILQNKNVEVLESDKLPSLINKVDSIEIEKHKMPKWFDSRDFWGKGAIIPKYSTIPGCCTVGDDIYVVGGYASGAATNTNLRYNTVTNVWYEENPIPILASNGASCTVGNKFYFANGSTGEFFVYDTISKTWERKADIITNVYGHKMACIGDNIYLFGGKYNGNVYTYMQIYNIPTNTWSSQSITISGTKYDINIEVIDNFLYVFGGIDSGGLTPYVRKYDTITKIWSNEGMFSAGFSSACSFVDGYNLYAIGGRMDSISNSSQNRMFNTITKASTIKNPINVGRSYASCGFASGIAYVFGGNAVDGISNAITEFYVV